MSSPVIALRAQPHARNPRPRLHPITDHLITHHDQDDWSMTDDGLICAPIGFYRIMERFGDTENRDARTLVFGFQPNDLDLVPHPDDPSRLTLRSPAYILPPIHNHFVKGWAETEMRKHQGDWLDFVLGFGNLYRTEQGSDEYFSNNFASYGIFPNHNELGQIIDYRVSLRIDPHNRSYGFGLAQDREDSLHDWRANRGLVLKDKLKTRGEAIRLIHADFRNRYKSFLKNEEVQRWDDPHLFQNMLMWFDNVASESRRRPRTMGSIISKSLDIGLTKLNPYGLVIEAGIEMLERGAEEEEHGNAIHEIAEINEQSLAPLHSMKEDVRTDWVALPVAQARRALLTNFRICHDIESHRRARAVDIIHNLDPVIVMSGADPSITVRAHNGMEVHYLPSGERYATYSPHRAIEPLPSLFKPFFEPSGANIARIVSTTNGDTLLPGQQVLHTLPHGRGKRLITDFEPVEVVREKVKNYEHIMESVTIHRAPSFADAPVNTEVAKTLPQSIAHYANVLHPFNDARNPKDWYLGAASLAFGAAASASELGNFLQAASPWAFALGAGLMTRRVASNALTKEGRRNLTLAAQTCFTLGPISLVGGLAKETLPEILSGTITLDKDAAEKVGGIAAASIISVQRARRLGAILRSNLRVKTL